MSNGDIAEPQRWVGRGVESSRHIVEDHYPGLVVHKPLLAIVVVCAGQPIRAFNEPAMQGRAATNSAEMVDLAPVLRAMRRPRAT